MLPSFSNRTLYKIIIKHFWVNTLYLFPEALGEVNAANLHEVTLLFVQVEQLLLVTLLAQLHHHDNKTGQNKTTFEKEKHKRWNLWRRQSLEKKKWRKKKEVESCYLLVESGGHRSVVKYPEVRVRLRLVLLVAHLLQHTIHCMATVTMVTRLHKTLPSLPSLTHLAGGLHSQWPCPEQCLPSAYPSAEAPGPLHVPHDPTTKTKERGRRVWSINMVTI